MKIKNIMSTTGTVASTLVCAAGTIACGYDAVTTGLDFFKGRGTENAKCPVCTGVTIAEDAGLGLLLGKSAFSQAKKLFHKSPVEKVADDLEAAAENLTDDSAN